MDYLRFQVLGKALRRIDAGTPPRPLRRDSPSRGTSPAHRTPIDHVAGKARRLRPPGRLAPAAQGLTVPGNLPDSPTIHQSHDRGGDPARSHPAPGAQGPLSGGPRLAQHPLILSSVNRRPPATGRGYWAPSSKAATRHPRRNPEGPSNAGEPDSLAADEPILGARPRGGEGITHQGLIVPGGGRGSLVTLR